MCDESLSYLHVRCSKQVTERVKEQVDARGGVKVSVAHDLARKQSLARTAPQKAAHHSVTHVHVMCDFLKRKCFTWLWLLRTTRLQWIKSDWMMINNITGKSILIRLAQWCLLCILVVGSYKPWKQKKKIKRALQRNSCYFHFKLTKLTGTCSPRSQFLQSTLCVC